MTKNNFAIKVAVLTLVLFVFFLSSALPQPPPPPPDPDPTGGGGAGAPIEGGLIYLVAIGVAYASKMAYTVKLKYFNKK